MSGDDGACARCHTPVLFSRHRQRRRRTWPNAEREMIRKHEQEREATREKYAAAFERVRLVRAWIAAAAALLAVISAYVAVIERVVR